MQRINFPSALMAAVAFLLFARSSSQPQSIRRVKSLNDSSLPTTGDPQQPRPIMYTFYAAIHDHPFNMPAGMSHTAHEELTDLWKKTWWDAGWEPRVLTEDDAKKHPDYSRLQAMVDQIETGSYDKLCFMRWVAMSAVGGGWMADYDVFPLHDFRYKDGFKLPNDGVLTIHNRYCPSLVSGVASEWDRMANRLIAHGLAKQLKTDQRTAVALHQKSQNMFMMEYSVTQHMYNTTQWGPKACEKYTPTTMRAAHFAHVPLARAKAEGKLPATFAMDQRPAVAAQWLEMWHTTCGAKVFQGHGPLMG